MIIIPGMNVTQADLRFLYLLRGAWAGGADRAAAEGSLRAEPGRAAGRVAAWSLRRAVASLGQGARRRLIVGESLAPSADERRLIAAARQLSQGEARAAEDTLAWLVRAPFAGLVADALREGACAAYGYAAPRRAKAASA